MAERWFPNSEWVLLLALAVEIGAFAVLGENFFSWANFFEVIRLSVELGLLALALTPVMITGGIDLSVGSMMGLAAVVFGAAWRDWGLPIAGAIVLALLVGVVGGALNAILITRWNIPPIIVTLGSFSMFRGIAEGLTHGAVNYSGFPSGFLQLGQGYIWGVIPVQFPIFVLAFAGYAVLLHRSVVGRTLYAIGFNAAGARYAGIRVERRTALAYLLCGLVSSLAAVIYVAHLGQAKSRCRNGLRARRNYGGGLRRDVCLRRPRNGVGNAVRTIFHFGATERFCLRLAALPSRNLPGVLTGTVLIATIALRPPANAVAGSTHRPAWQLLSREEPPL